MATKKLILGLLAILFSYTTYSQEATVNFAKFRITANASHESVKQLDQFIRSQNGVLVSRIDPLGKTYFAKYDPSVIASPETFEQWLNTIGITVSCKISGVFEGQTPDFPKECFPESDSDTHHIESK